MHSGGINLLVVMFPDEMQVNSPLQSEVLAASKHSPDQFDFALPDRMLSRELENMNVKQLDLLQPFKQVFNSRAPLQAQGYSLEHCWKQVGC